MFQHDFLQPKYLIITLNNLKYNFIRDVGFMFEGRFNFIIYKLIIYTLFIRFIKYYEQVHLQSS